MGRSNFRHKLQNYKSKELYKTFSGFVLGMTAMSFMGVTDAQARPVVTDENTSQSVKTVATTIDKNLTNFRTMNEERLKLQYEKKAELENQGIDIPLSGKIFVAPAPAPKKMKDLPEMPSETSIATSLVLPVAPAATAPSAAIAHVASVSGSAYPYANAPFPNSIPDEWGMYQRQCVSYAAWKVAASGRHMPYWGGRGDASSWDDNAVAAGIPVDTSPRPGDVAVDNSGGYGHVMYVEAVNGDGTIRISEYNARWDGTYSEGTRSAAGLIFIHF